MWKAMINHAWYYWILITHLKLFNNNSSNKIYYNLDDSGVGIQQYKFILLAVTEFKI